MVLLRHEPSVQDVLQEIFAKLAKGRGRWTSPETERAYLLQMVRRAAIDLSRREKVRREHAERHRRDPIFERSEDPDREAFRERLEVALMALPEEQRIVTVLKLWEERTFEEIATICEISPHTAASRYRYAIDKLRHHLRPLYEEL